MLKQIAHILMGLLQIVNALSIKKKYLVAFALGIFSTLAMPPVFFWPILFLTFPALIWLMDSIHANEESSLKGDQRNSLRIKSKKQFLVGWFFGFGYFLVSLYWLGSSFLVEPEKFAWALPLAVILLPAALGLFYAIPLLIGSLIWSKGPERLLTFSIVIFSSDWLRGHILTGFPWNLIGHSLTGQLAMMQNVAVFGIYGLSAIAALIFAAPATLACLSNNSEVNQRSQASFLPILFSIFVLSGMFIFGQNRVSMAGPTKFIEGIEFVLIQPNISQKDKVDISKRPKALLKTIELTETLPPLDKDKFQQRIIIWPETAVPFALNKAPQILERLDKLLPKGSTLITGAFHVEQEAKIDNIKNSYKVYNSLFVINDQGQITSIYDKNHLVPFGEYLPFPQLLRSIGLQALADERGGFQTGPEPKPVHLPNGPSFLPSICYEAIFPLKDTISQEGANWLLNISNDGWFGNTVGPHQHLHQVKIRSVETGLPMVRVVNGGISSVYDGIGRVIKKTSLSEARVLTSELPVRSKLVLKKSSQDWLVFLVLLAFWILISTKKILTKRYKFTSKQ